MAPAFRHITWNPDEYTAFRASVRAGDVVLEAGANVGAYTMLFAQWAGPAGRVAGAVRDASPRASAVPCEGTGASARAVLASVRCIGP